MIKSAFQFSLSSRIADRGDPIMTPVVTMIVRCTWATTFVAAAFTTACACSRATRSIWSKNSDDIAQAWGVGASGTSNADTILISLLAGQGRVANSLTAASLQADTSIAKRILIT